MMKVHVGLDGGYLADRFGKYASAADKDGGHASRRSFPFEVDDVPEDAQALAWLLLDWDSIPVCGLPWVHWCAWLDDGRDMDDDMAPGLRDSAGPVGGAESESVAVPEDASRQGVEGLHQGRTSGKGARGVFGVGYEGPCPPDKDHVYTLYVAALDEAPQGLDEPFWANELVAACRGHILALAKAELPSRA